MDADGQALVIVLDIVSGFVERITERKNEFDLFRIKAVERLGQIQVESFSAYVVRAALVLIFCEKQVGKVRMLRPSSRSW